MDNSRRKLSADFIDNLATRVYRLKTVLQCTGVSFPTDIEDTLHKLTLSFTDAEPADSSQSAFAMLPHTQPCVPLDVLWHSQDNEHFVTGACDRVQEMNTLLASSETELGVRHRENQELQQMIKQLEQQLESDLSFEPDSERNCVSCSLF